jgi:hypothetical protein
MGFRRKVSNSQRSLLVCARVDMGWSKRWNSLTMNLWPAPCPSQTGHQGGAKSGDVGLRKNEPYHTKY